MNWKEIVPLMAALALAGACASASARTKAADSPGLTVPQPPARVIEPGPEPPPEPVSDLPQPSAPAATPPRGPRREAPPKADPKPAEPKPGEQPPPPVEQPPVSAPAPVQPPAQLRTPETADTSNAAKTIRTILERAGTLLKGVDYGPLSNDRKKAYDDARRFMQQAEDALKQGNLAFAQGVATKAETLAKELAGR